MCNENDASEQFSLQRSSKSRRSKLQLRQQNSPRSKSNSNKATFRPPLVNGHTNHFSLGANGWYENGHRNEDNDGLEEDKNYRRSRTSSDTFAGCLFANDNGDDAVDDNEDESEDGNYVLKSNSSKDAECHTGESNGLGGQHGEFDVDGNIDAGGGNDDADHDDDNDGDDGYYDSTQAEHGDDHGEEDGDTGDRGSDNQHHPHHRERSDGGGGSGKIDSSDGRQDDVKDNGDHGDVIIDSNYDHEYDNDDADDENDLVIQDNSLPVDNNVPRKTLRNVKLATKDSKFSLSVNNSSEDKVIKSNPVKEKPPGATGKTLITSNVNATKEPAISYCASLSQEARPKTSSPRLPQGDLAEQDHLYNSRIPSLEATGIDQNFLARHTTDQSLQHASQSGDFNLPRKSTSRRDWPVWSLPPPQVSETRDLTHRWPQSSGLNPSVVDNQTAAQSSWQFRNQPWRKVNYSNFSQQEQKSFNHVDPWFAREDEALSRLRLFESLPGTTGTEAGNSFNTHAWTPSAYGPSCRYSSSNFNESQASRSTYGGLALWDKPPASWLPTVKSHAPAVSPSITSPTTELQPTASITSQSAPSYSYLSSVLPEKGQERLVEPFKPIPLTENQDVRPIFSSEITASGREEQRTGIEASSPDSHDQSLAALERKVAEACAVVERVMREREERTKAQREEARKKRETREQREREVREMREREERERREREEREIREREERKMREREERERREQKENEDRETRWYGGERAPVQESPRWQCEHYQRHCRVKFSCCGVFYPCHRCHNTSGACDNDDRKANNATHVKCGICGHEEEINEGSQYCSGCGEQMSAYFCFICKHFTGVEKNPFHCDKCGICRIHKDKSFHCDVCNVCLDKRLERKHKCRPDSGHDECCICLEDAFSGCQILPCSHKVHKECAIAMIQNGVRNCPICRHPLFSQDSQ